MCISILKKRN